ncbi:MAG: hypothetical protein K2H47_01635 [Muribaculaceae bacterium]|nr:hypothetical protein [Muribaculaceae bacterium]
MADNYLERKMEDLRSGRLGTNTGKLKTSRAMHSSQAATGNRRILNFNFTSRRILIIGGCSGVEKSITQAFVRAGCRVAVFDTDLEESDNMAKNGSIRFYPIAAEALSAVEAAWQNLITAWHDVDTVIVTAQIPYTLTLALAQWWASRRSTHPAVSLHNSIIIILYPTKKYLDQDNLIPKNDTSSQSTSIAEQEEANTVVCERNIDTILYSLYSVLHHHKINVKALGYINNIEQTVQNCLFLAVPDMGNNRIIMC